MANRRFIDFPIATTVGNNDIVLIWQDGLNKQTTKATLFQGSPQSLAGLTDVDISALNNGQILQFNSTTSKWENVDRTDINLSELGDVTIVAPSNGQVLVYNSSTGKWENSSGGYVPYTGAVTTVNLGAQTIQAGSFVKAGGTSAQFLKANGSVDSTAYGTGTVTSVALTMPSAFSVGGSPITTAGTLAVTGAGTVGQYIRGDGSLADFPATTGGGSSVSYYLNGSVSQGTIGGVAYKELNRTPIFGAGTDISINADGYIASFITDALDPNKLLIPGGNWNFETYFSASSSGGSPSFYVELYKYDGTTFTLLATSSSAPELIAFGTNLNPYFSTLAVPETVLALTDRLAVRFYVTHSGRTITLHTENGHLCQVITTFTTGLTALNGLTNQVQFFAVGTSGTDFAISSASDTHTFNLPTATSTIRGALSSADWSTFNGKQNALTLTTTGTSGAATLVGSTLNIPQYQAAGTYVTAVTASSPLASSGGTTPNITIQQASGSQSGFLSSTDWTTFNNKQNALINPVTGTGTSGQVAYFNGTSAITSESNLFWDATNDRLGIGINTPLASLQVGNGTQTALNLAGNKIHIATNSTRSALVTLANSGGGTTVEGIFESSAESSDLRVLIGATSNHPVVFRANNAEAARIFTNGNLGIGTGDNNAGFKLDVNGTGRFIGPNASGRGQLSIQSNNASNAAKVTWYYDTTQQGEIGTTSGDFYALAVNNFLFYAGGSTRLTIASTGEATFTSSVQTSTFFRSNTPTTNSITIGVSANANYNYIGNSNFWGIRTGTSGDFNIDLNNSGSPINALRIASTGAATFSGDVTISKTSPTFRITRGNTSASSLVVYNTNGTDDWLIGTGVTGTNSDYRVYNNGLGADAMYITKSTNNVLIGTSTNYGQKMVVYSSGTTRVRIDGGGNNSGVLLAESGTSQWSLASVSGTFLFYNEVTGQTRFSLTSTGAATFNSLGTGSVTATAGLLSTVSDLTYKIDDGFIDSAIEKVLSLKPRYFYWNEKSGLPKDIRQLGFYAQEVNEALGEEAANTPKDKNTAWGISDRSIIAMLTKAIQELKQEIDTLKN